MPSRLKPKSLEGVVRGNDFCRLRINPRFPIRIVIVCDHHHGWRGDIRVNVNLIRAVFFQCKEASTRLQLSGSYSLSVSALDPNIGAQFGGRTRGNRIQYLVFAVKNVSLLRQEKPRQRVAVRALPPRRG